MAFIDTSGLEPFAEMIKEIYGDVAKPGVVQAGYALATVVGLINTCLSPVRFLNEKTELNRQKNLEKLAERFSEIPPENITEVPPEIAVPIAEKLVYVSNDELRDMYIELLAKASTIDLNNTAHPSFVNIINNLCPDEAFILKDVHISRMSAILCLEVRLNNLENNTFRLITPYHTKYHNNSELSFSANSSAYISNLIGLGILQHSEMVSTNESIYQELEKEVNDEYENYKNNSENQQKIHLKNEELETERMQVFITPFGKLLLKAIMPPLIDIKEETT